MRLGLKGEGLATVRGGGEGLRKSMRRVMKEEEGSKSIEWTRLSEYEGK